MQEQGPKKENKESSYIIIMKKLKNGNFVARLSNEKGNLCEGKSSAEALGKLLLSHPDKFDLSFMVVRGVKGTPRFEAFIQEGFENDTNLENFSVGDSKAESIGQFASGINSTRLKFEVVWKK